MYRLKIVTLLTLAVVITAAAGAYWYVTAHGFSARAKPNRLEALLARKVRRLATPSAAIDARNPLKATPLNVAEARDHFADHCAICHANDGSGRTQINAGLYPPAPDMRESETQELTDGEIFYIIKNGIRFTGMPGWGGGEDENWKLVLFIRHLPKVTQTELELMEEVNGLELTTGEDH